MTVGEGASTASRGRVRVWHDDEGWGVIDSEAAPGGCWVHFSTVLVEGHHALQTGQDVTFDVQVGDQDGYRYVATGVWPTGETPVRTPASGPGPGYSSNLEIGVGPEPESS